MLPSFNVVKQANIWHAGSSPRPVNSIVNTNTDLRLQESNGFLLNVAGAPGYYVDSAVYDRDRIAVASRRATFSNPIIPSPSADPWMLFHEGFYYYCESRNQSSIHIRKARTLNEIGYDEGEQIWEAPMVGNNSKAVWAPELHRLNGKWYVYYAADDGLNENHRMWVLESLGENPQGGYRCRGCIETQGWAIDGTVLEIGDQMYFLWSGWPGKVNGQQNLYIAPMSNPWTISGERTLLAAPERDWECVDMAICEGPQVLQRNGKIFVIYSASGSWTVDYCLAMLALKGGDPLDASNWENRGRIFETVPEVLGVGHCSFVTSA
ncbi:MAG: putative beta-xylosidase, partial [Verrucomicrobiales bacterium]|nr:putative beta-xylosidase [Verrucomicrobiales bacterium]